MEDLLQSQIRESCRLALPEGLRDLMSDISREVLREQPTDLYDFIASYLKSMLVARETLCIACRVCRDVCQCVCDTELDEELRDLGLREEDLETAKNVVMEYFDKDEVHEGNLLMKLFRNTNFDPNLLPDIQDAVRNAFQKHMRARQAKYWADTDKADDVAQKAVKHTLIHHERAEEDKNQSWDDSAIRLQAYFHGAFTMGKVPLDETALKLRYKLAQIGSSELSLQQRHMNKQTNDHEKATTSKPSKKLNNIDHSKNKVSLSSISLAGSFIDLPEHIPYSAHGVTYYNSEERETERKNIDDTLDTKKEEANKKIAFFNRILYKITSSSIVDEDNIEEHIAEESKSDTISVEENIIEDNTVDYIGQELGSAHDEDLVAVKSFTKDVIQRSVSDNDTALTNDIVSNINEMSFEEKLSVIDTYEHQVEEDLEGMSFDAIHNDEQEYLVNYDDEEEIDNKDDQEMEKHTMNEVISKADMQMAKQLKKKLIHLSYDNLREYSSSDDED